MGPFFLPHTHSSLYKTTFPFSSLDSPHDLKSSKKRRRRAFFCCPVLVPIPSSLSFIEMSSLYLSLTLLSLIFVSGVYSATFTFTNNCNHMIWPGILSNAGTAQLDSTGFALDKGETRTLAVPTAWSGRLWGRTVCSEDSTGKFTCITGDCGSGKIECAGGGAAPPATLAEFTLNGADGLDFYDLSLVDGYNLPMLVVSTGGTGGNCSTTGCVVELNGACPQELKVTSTDGNDVACKSACEAFGDPQYCCSGAYGNPDTCKPSMYSEFFKNACPRAYSYAYDDKTSTFTCAAADYVITFCPSMPTSKKASENPKAADLPLINTTMVFLGGEDISGSSRTRWENGQLIPAAVAVLVAIWRLWQL